jgi:hypothetical protein
MLPYRIFWTIQAHAHNHGNKPCFEVSVLVKSQKHGEGRDEIKVGGAGKVVDSVRDVRDIDSG